MIPSGRRRLVALRSAHPELREGDLTLLDGSDDVLAYRRGGALTVVANFGDRPVPVRHRGRVLVASGRAGLTGGLLAPCEAVVLGPDLG